MLLRMLTHTDVVLAPDEQNLGKMVSVSKYVEDTSIWGKGQMIEFPRLLEMS